MRAPGYAALLTASAITLIAPPSHAQRAGDGFLFHVPIGTWGVRGGINLASANSDVFAFVTDQLTLDRSDFNAPAVGTNIAIRLSGSNDLVLDVSYSTVSHASEFRHWVDQNDQPIEQTTSLRRIPITLGFRHYVTSRGRSVGQFAWIPARRSLYVGLGGGMMEYKFHQVGDFIDFTTRNVFHDEFISQDWTGVAQANAGLDLALGDFVLLNTEARYSWAKAPMSSDYVGFKHIDLSGLSVTAGFSFRLY
jgi:hypothetical protein